MKQPVATFERDGQTRDAYTAGEATSLRNAGWSQVIGETGPETVHYPTPVPVSTTTATADLLTPTTESEAGETPKPETKRAHHKRKKDDQA